MRSAVVTHSVKNFQNHVNIWELVFVFGNAYLRRKKHDDEDENLLIRNRKLLQHDLQLINIFVLLMQWYCRRWIDQDETIFIYTLIFTQNRTSNLSNCRHVHVKIDQYMINFNTLIQRSFDDLLHIIILVKEFQISKKIIFEALV